QTVSLHPVLAARYRVVRERFKQSEGGPAVVHSAATSVADSDATLSNHRCGLISIETERISVETPGRERRLISIHENQALQILATFSRERSAQRLVLRFVKDWREFAEELKEPLEPIMGQASEGEAVLLALAGAPLVAVPWELGVPSSLVPIRIGNGRNEG